jgi:hypothetical protein
VTTDLNTLLTGLYVHIDDHLGARHRIGRPPKLTDAELATLAVAQVLLEGALRGPSTANSTSNCTAGAASPASAHASPNDYWP